MRDLGMVTLCITQNKDNADEIAQFLLYKKNRPCSGWVVASKSSTEDIPDLCYCMYNFVKFLNLMLENGMAITNRYVLNMMAQAHYLMAKPSVRCLLRHCSEQQRLELFKAVTESAINKKYDLLSDILESGSINKKQFKPYVCELIWKFPDCLTEKLVKLEYVDSHEESE